MKKMIGDSSDKVTLRKAVKFYDAVTDVFEKDYYSNDADPSLAFDVEEIWEIMKPNLNEGQKILEIGCGTGHWLLKIKNELGAHSFGIDFSEEMIRTSSKRGLHGVVVAEASELPFPSLYFDAVISPLNALDHCVEYHQAFNEIDRVLKSSGVALLMVDNKQRIIKRYWHIDIPKVQSLEGDPRSSEMWTHLVDGEEVTVYSHFYTIDEVASLMPRFDLKINGIGIFSPLIPRFLRKRTPKFTRFILHLLRRLERFVSRSFPSIAAHLFIIGKK